MKRCWRAVCAPQAQMLGQWEVSIFLGTPHRVPPWARPADKAARLLLSTCSLLNTIRLVVGPTPGWADPQSHPLPGVRPSSIQCHAFAKAKDCTGVPDGIREEAAYVPVQRGDVFVTGDVGPPSRYSASATQLREPPALFSFRFHILRSSLRTCARNTARLQAPGPRASDTHRCLSPGWVSIF